MGELCLNAGAGPGAIMLLPCCLAGAEGRMLCVFHRLFFEEPKDGPEAW